MNVWTWAIGAVGLGLLVYIGLPRLLNLWGLHPHYWGPQRDLSGKRALIVTTSQGTLGDTTKKTGVWASEMTAPYYEFLAAGMQVDLASIRGGPIPIDPPSLRWPIASAADKRFLRDAAFRHKAGRSFKIDDLDFSDYDLVFLAGGWGAAYDLGTSDVLGRKVSEAYAAGRILGAVCHGGLGLLRATDPEGEPLVKGLHATAVSDKQIRELGINKTPQHPETELRKAGAIYEHKRGLLDVLAHHVVVDGRIVTGQNQNAGAEVANRMMDLLEKR